MPVIRSETMNVAWPAARPTAVSRTSTQSMSLSARFSRIAATFSGTGSNATTRPDGPTRRAARIVTKPTLAPMSKKVVPGLTSR